MANQRVVPKDALRLFGESLAEAAKLYNKPQHAVIFSEFSGCCLGKVSINGWRRLGRFTVLRNYFAPAPDLSKIEADEVKALRRLFEKTKTK